MYNIVHCRRCKIEIDKSISVRISNSNYCEICSKIVGIGKGHNRKRKLNTILIEGDLSFIIPNNSDQLILVDTSDIEILSKYTWNLNNSGYAVSKINSKTILLHSLITGFKFNRKNKHEIDHINGNRIDNRKANLRLVTPNCNTTNRYYKCSTGERYISKYNKGVRCYGYLVNITIDGKQTHFGCYKTIEDAIYKRDKVIAEYNLEEPYCGWSSLPFTAEQYKKLVGE